jgi:hypothetical protein
LSGRIVPSPSIIHTQTSSFHLTSGLDGKHGAPVSGNSIVLQVIVAIQDIIFVSN